MLHKDQEGSCVGPSKSSGGALGGTLAFCPCATSRSSRPLVSLRHFGHPVVKVRRAGQGGPVSSSLVSFPLSQSHSPSLSSVVLLLSKGFDL